MLSQLQVHRGEAQDGAQLLAVGDPVAEGVGMAQKFVGPLDLPLGHQGADVGGGDGDALLLYLGDDVTAQAQLLADLLQTLGVALPLVAKVVVVAGHQMDSAQVTCQGVHHEIPPGLLHPLGGEGLHNHVLDAVVLAHQVRPVLRRGEQGHGTAQNHGLGVGIKGKGRGGGADLLGHLGGAAHEGGVAVVHPVKKAQGDDTFFLFQLHYTSKKLLIVVRRPASCRARARNSCWRL